MYRILLVALAAAAATPAFANDLATPPYPNLDLTGFSGDPNALPNAVTAIESASSGRVLGIRYNNEGGAPGYDVVLARGNQISFERVSPSADGASVTTSRTEPARSLDWKARATVKDILAAKVSLADAIRTAEARRWGAPAVAAGLDPKSTNPTDFVTAYNVAVLQRGNERRVAVDANTGQTIADPGGVDDTLDDWL